MLKKILETYVKDRNLIIIWLSVAFIISSDWLLPWSDKLFELYPAPEKLPLGKAVVIMCVLCLALLASLIVLHYKLMAKPNPNDYEIINPPGFMKHKATGGYFCQPCLLLKQLPSQLSTIDKKQMLCRICKETYDIDYSVLICDEYLSMIHNRAVSELIHKNEKDEYPQTPADG